MNIDIIKNKEFYKKKNDLCTCDACKNYYLQIEKEYPKIKEYLDNIGVDILKPNELMWESENEEIKYLNCEYVIFGKCEDDFEYIIDDIEITKDKMHAPVNVNDEYFVLGIGIITLKNIMGSNIN